jgi:putative solute:sodium symporter small subunit
MPFDPMTTTTTTRDAYWTRTRRLTMLLLCAWFAVTFCVIFFARSLSNFTLFGWSFSYYMAAQGTLLIYLILVASYAWRMDRLDKMLKREEGNDK